MLEKKSMKLLVVIRSRVQIQRPSQIYPLRKPPPLNNNLTILLQTMSSFLKCLFGSKLLSINQTMNLSMLRSGVKGSSEAFAGLEKKEEK